MNEQKCGFSGAALSLSVTAAILGQCIRAGAFPSVRALLWQGLPLALGLTLLAALLAAAEAESAIFSGDSFRSRLVCGLFAVWFAWELWETLCGAQALCWASFSSRAIVGILPLLLWAGWKLEPAVFSRSAGVLWWALALAVLVLCAGLWGQFQWQNLQLRPEIKEQITLPLLPEFFALPLLSAKEQKKLRKHCTLPLQAFGLLVFFTLGRELLVGNGEAFPDVRLGMFSRFDAVFLLAFLAVALFRACLLVCILQTLLRRTWCGKTEVQP